MLAVFKFMPIFRLVFCFVLENNMIQSDSRLFKKLSLVNLVDYDYC